MAQQSLQREGWGNRFGAIMAMAGMAVGLGNVWRFPYLVGEYGGGAFVFAYLFSLILIVSPLAAVEAAFGKGIQGGNLDAWALILRNKTVGKIMGSICSLGYATQNFFYMFVLAGSVYFMYVFASDMKSTMAPETIYGYMNNSQLKIMLVLTIAVCLFMIFIVYKGIESGVEKISKYMVPAIFLIFIIIIVAAAVTTPNIAEGYNYYLNPDWSQLRNPKLWKEAVAQGLFSVGVGPGCVLVYGSHIKRHEDVTLSILTVCMVDTSVALMAGFAIIPTCIAMGLDPTSGSGLLYVVLPSALAQIPMGNFLGVMAMLAVFFAGITSAVAQLEVAVTSFSDGLKKSRKVIAVVLGIPTLIMACVCVFSTSQFDFWNNFTGNYTFVVTAGCGAIGYNYLYGTKRIRTEFMNPGSDIQFGAWFDPIVKFVAVPLMMIIMADSLFPFL